MNLSSPLPHATHPRIHVDPHRPGVRSSIWRSRGYRPSGRFEQLHQRFRNVLPRCRRRGRTGYSRRPRSARHVLPAAAWAWRLDESEQVGFVGARAFFQNDEGDRQFSGIAIRLKIDELRRNLRDFIGQKSNGHLAVRILTGQPGSPRFGEFPSNIPEMPANRGLSLFRQSLSLADCRTFPCEIPKSLPPLQGKFPFSEDLARRLKNKTTA